MTDPHFLYQITTPNGSYIGVAKNLKRRFRSHCKSTTLLGIEIGRVGRENVGLRILACGNRDYIYALEISAIQKFQTRFPSGYNISPGGFGSRDLLPSTKRKLAEAARRDLVRLAKLIEAGKRPETRRKQIEANKGRVASDETCAKMSEARKGIPKSLEHRARIGASHQGKKRASFSAEWRAKLSKNWPKYQRILLGN